MCPFKTKESQLGKKTVQGNNELSKTQITFLIKSLNFELPILIRAQGKEHQGERSKVQNQQPLTTFHMK